MSTADEKSRRIRGMFDRIGHRYDLLNHLLSGCSDIWWRRSAVRALNHSEGDLLLDVGIGTGDLALEVLKGKGKPRLIVGVDAALRMMRIGRKKTESPARRAIRFVGGQAESLPLRTGVFDGAMVAFGVRNFTDRAAGLRCIRRVLKPGGRLVVLELSLPRYPVIRPVVPALRQVRDAVDRRRHLGRCGGLPVPSGLGGSVPGARAVPNRSWKEAGFVETGWRDLSLGAATVYWGEKRP